MATPKTKTFDTKKQASDYTGKLAKKGDISPADAKRVQNKLGTGNADAAKRLIRGGKMDV